MAHPPVVHRVMSGLVRAELNAVNPHTLAVALARAETEQVLFDSLEERRAAVALLERASYPDTINELNLFLNVAHPLSMADLLPEEITAERAVNYMRWIAAFLNDPEADIQRNARVLLRWLVANHRMAIAANQSLLGPLRGVADDPVTPYRVSAFLVYALGNCGTIDDYERVIRHAELVIQHDLEHLDLAAEGLYRLYPPALINALLYFLEHTPGSKQKEFATGVHLLSKVADIDDQGFWRTYYADMEAIVERLQMYARRNRAIEHVIDSLEKRLAEAALGDEQAKDE